MSLDFAIIPVSSNFVTAANYLQTKLKDNIKLEMTIIIDTNYEIPFNNRINKWKKQQYDTITINDYYDKCNSIVVRFSNKGSRAQSMHIDEFIDLINSYDDNEQNDSNTDNTNTETNEEGGCILS